MIVRPRPLVIGHRGNPGNPLNTRKIENIIPSFNSALGICDGIECDVGLSAAGKILLKPGKRFGVPFAHHDDTFGRVVISPDGDDSKHVSMYPWEAIKRARFIESDTARIPSLDEVPLIDGKFYL